MKNKKLLSILCLVALTGCSFSNSTSTNNQTPSSPASSSTVAPSSPVSSSTEEVSSTNNSSTNTSTENSSTVDSSSTTPSSPSTPSSPVEESTPVVTPSTADDEMQKAMAAVAEATTYEEDLVAFEFAKTSSSNSNVERKSAEFHSNYTEYTDSRETTNYSGETTVTVNKSFRTVENNRYYEVATNASDSANPTITSVNGYDIVEETVTPAEKTQAEVDVALGFASGTVDGFGMAKSLEALFAGAFENYDSEFSYGIAFEKQYTSATSSNFVYSSISYYTEPTSEWSTTVYKYTSEFTYDDAAKVTGVTFIQDTFYGVNYDFEAHTPIAAANSSYKWTYSFEFGEKTESEKPYNVSSLLLTDYEVKSYRDSARTEEATEFEMEDNLYFSFIGTPETATADLPIIESIVGDSICYTSAGSSPLYIYLSNAGTATFTFVSAGGIRKSIEITVKAPAPTGISFNADMPTVVPALVVVALPECNIAPYGADKSYEWKVVEGNEFAEVVYSEDTGLYSVKGVAAGIAKLQANSKVDPTIVTDVYEVEIVSPKTEAEMNTIITTTDWAFNDGTIYHAAFNTDGTAEIVLGKDGYYDSNSNRVDNEEPTKFTFNWSLDYNNCSIVITNGTWVNRLEKGEYSSWTDPVITPSLLGEKININFGGSYNFDFVAAMTAEQLHEKFSDYVAEAYLFEFHYIDLYIEFAEDVITFYQQSYNSAAGGYVTKNVVEVEYTWNADGNIELAEAVTLQLDTYQESFTVVVSTVIEVEQVFGAYFYLSFTDTATNTLHTERISSY